ncbi:MAG: preprotein translocase subunit SecE [Candidatus Paceibacterota bacterium]
MDYVTRFINYVKDTQGELLHVSWPTRKQAMIYTAIVIVVSIVIAVFLGFFDFLFTYLLENYVI